MQREKKGHHYLDAMRPATRISVPNERNQKESTQFRMGNHFTKIKGKGKNNRSNSEGGKGDVKTQTSMRGDFFVVFVLSLSACSIASIELKYWVFSSINTSKYRVWAVYQYEEGRHTQYLNVSLVRQPSKYLVYQSINSISTM